MQAFKTAVLATSLVALAGCENLDTYFVHQKDVCLDGWYGYWQQPCPAVPAAKG